MIDDTQEKIREVIRLIENEPTDLDVRREIDKAEFAYQMSCDPDERYRLMKFRNYLRYQVRFEPSLESHQKELTGALKRAEDHLVKRMKETKTSTGIFLDPESKGEES